MAAMFYKWFAVICIYPALMVNSTKERIAENSHAPAHPYFVSVVEINHNASDKTLEITCRIFTDDFEETLGAKYKTRVDLINPPDRKAMDHLVSAYITDHLSLKTDGKTVQFSYLGFEQEEDAVYSYFQVNNIQSLKKLEVVNNILHDLTENQINIMHVTVNGTRKSTKLDFPKKEAVFNF